MPFERETLWGEKWLVCHGQTQRRLHGLLEELQREYGRGFDCVWGKGAGNWEALWLAEQYDVRMLVLEDMNPRQSHLLRRRALHGLYAVVCPVILSGGMRLSLPNAAVYCGELPEILPVVQAIRQENTNGL